MVDSNRLDALETNLEEKLKQAGGAVRTSLPAEEIKAIVKEVMTTLTGDMTAADLKFYVELEELAAYIRHAKEEIAEIKPKDISVNHIPHATDELDAVVGATEEATNKIMDVCDTITELAGKCGEEVSGELISCTTRIYEACNFQDITGQRITKVVQTLKYIDSKVEALLKALGEEINKDELRIARGSDEEIEKALLNGPQLPQNAINQDEIDRLMSES